MDEFSEYLSFKKMITPMVIQIIFWIGAVLSVLSGLGAIIAGLFRRGGIGLAFMGLVYVFVGPLIVRIWCELVIVAFRMLDEIIAAHGGEARFARDAYLALAPSARETVIAFLRSLVIEAPP